MQQTANVNPFTTDSLLARNKKRCCTQLGRDNLSNKSLLSFLNSDDDGDRGDQSDQMAEILQAPKRLALQDTNISRYKKEFVEISLIDGCIYAIKKSIKPVAGSSFEKRALNEVWAHSVLGKNNNVVRYYWDWTEDNHMLIQNEYCNGGSLQSHRMHYDIQSWRFGTCNICKGRLCRGRRLSIFAKRDFTGRL